jgi:hypothetical protein
MRLVSEIRDGVADSNVDISTVLRKAKILAVTLGNQEFKDWISQELGGYSGKSETPKYRQIVSTPLGNFIDFFGNRIMGYLLPISQMPDFLQENARAICIPSPIREIESMARTGGDELRHPWSAEAVMLLRKHIQISGNYTLVEVYQPIGCAQLDAVVDAVRNQLLDFLLALQQINPLILESEDALRDLPKDTVSQVFHVSVSGSHNILATGSGFSQALAQSIPQYDRAALLAHLRQMGVSEGDLEDLGSALEKDGSQPRGEFGERLKGWMGKVMVKAMDGSWKIAAATAPEVLTKALSAYYGWS